jgi:hypothetical protein
MHSYPSFTLSAFSQCPSSFHYCMSVFMLQLRRRQGNSVNRLKGDVNLNKKLDPTSSKTQYKKYKINFCSGFLRKLLFFCFENYLKLWAKY